MSNDCYNIDRHIWRITSLKKSTTFLKRWPEKKLGNAVIFFNLETFLCYLLIFTFQCSIQILDIIMAFFKQSVF